MPNNIFNTLGQTATQGNMQGLMGQLNALKANPLQFLAQRNLKLPQNFNGGPKDMVQQLLNSGQMSQSQFNELQNKVNQMMGQIK